MRPGALCVMEHGQVSMQKWPAGSWDSHQLVCKHLVWHLCMNSEAILHVTRAISSYLRI